MQFTEFSFRLFLIFIPGVIGFLIVDSLTVHKATSPFFATLQSAVLGVLSYLIYYPISLAIGRPYHFISMISDAASRIDYVEVAIATALSIPIGLIIAALIYHKILFRFANWTHISRKISDPGVWSHVLSLDPKTTDTQWVSMVDRSASLLYLGFLQFFSDNSDLEHEYFLRNVDVYAYVDNKPGELLYQCPALYLNGPRERYQIEFPNMPYLPDPNENSHNQAEEESDSD